MAPFLRLYHYLWHFKNTNGHKWNLIFGTRFMSLMNEWRATGMEGKPLKGTRLGATKQRKR